MCGPNFAGEHDPMTPSRRSVLAGGALGLIPGTFAGDLGELGRITRPGARPGGIVRTATHVHTSFSEGEGGRVTVGGHSTAASMEGQAAAHAVLGVDLLFFTDHDHRFNAEGWGMRPHPSRRSRISRSRTGRMSCSAPARRAPATWSRPQLGE